MKTAEKLFLLDAYALIYRAYYALIKSPRINSKGLNTSAIMGFVNTLEEVLNKEKPSHIGIAFDPSGPTFRHELFEQYKAQREETPEVIRQSVPIIKDIINTGSYKLQTKEGVTVNKTWNAEHLKMYFCVINNKGSSLLESPLPPTGG